MQLDSLENLSQIGPLKTLPETHFENLQQLSNFDTKNGVKHIFCQKFWLEVTKSS